MEDNDLYEIIYEKIEKALLEAHNGNYEYIRK